MENMTGDRRWLTATIGATGFRTAVTVGPHSIIADEPLSAGGTDTGPTPYDYVLTALASCMVMTLRMYADRKKWPLEGVSVHLRSGRTHEQDCEKCETENVDIGKVERRIDLLGNLTDEQRQRMLEIADRCPVKQTLQRGLEIETIPPTFS